MSKALVIAEKPSVAGDIAKALGKFERKDDFFENEDYVISSAIGHLVELCLPGELDKKRGKWSFASLPIIPEEFDLKPIEKTESRFKLLKKLLKRADITEVINACDAGREGELIFRYLMKLAGINKPLRRLWLQSMTADSIRTAFSRMRSDEEMQPLANAAMCRSESDWLVGINGTRAMTAFNSKTGGFQLTPVGRVQTPTLAIMVEREEKIRKFKVRPYFEVIADFGVKAGVYRGRWVDETFRKGGDEDAKAERIWTEEKAQELKRKCLGKPGVISEEKKPTSQIAPLLYDLTSLQRDANGRFGFSARRTLQLAQQLYERHKVLTYPRTDSRYLPEDYLGVTRDTMGKFEDAALKVHADKALANNWIRLSKRIFDNAKVSDHHAIIPTGQEPKNLDEAQQKLYDLVAKRFIAVFYPPAQFEVTTRFTRVEGEPFKTEGKIIKDPGWMAVYGRDVETDGDKAIVAVQPGEPADTRDIEIKKSDTKPPPRYTEATLLSAMEGAGKLVDDEELRAAMSERGLGTPATRAAIIEGLLMDAYLIRQQKDLVPTAKGISLITLLRGLGVSALCSPEMTGEWEHKLKNMEQGELDREKFMNGIRELTREIVEKAKNFESDTVEGNFSEIEAKCPKCGGRNFKEDYRTFHCTACDYRLWKTLAGRLFDPEEVKTLLNEGRVGPLEGFRSKIGRAFSAIVKIGAELKPEFDFGNPDEDENGNAIDFSQYPVIADCTVCNQGKVHEMEAAYVCENTPKKKCKFRMGKSILQCEIPPQEVVKLLETGKTSLLRKFISKKGRPFDAFLKLEEGKVTFEFAPREAKPKKKAATAKE